MNISEDSGFDPEGKSLVLHLSSLRFILLCCNTAKRLVLETVQPMMYFFFYFNFWKLKHCYFFKDDIYNNEASTREWNATFSTRTDGFNPEGKTI